MPFKFKTVLVIGATSGIGLALAERIIENGSHVIAVGRRQENLDALVKKYGSEKVSAVRFDISDLEGIPAFAASITKAHPTLDSIILNSGMQRGLNFTKPASIDLSSISEEFTVNYLSHVHLTVAFLPYLQQHTSPTSLIYMTSGLALTPLPRCANYCATKAALHQLILVLREQLRDTNVSVVEILPPAVQTELHDAKHQPDIKDGGSIGMPLKEFTDKAWEGLEAGKEQIPVGMSETAYKVFEMKRQEMFLGMVKAMGNGT